MDKTFNIFLKLTHKNIILKYHKKKARKIINKKNLYEILKYNNKSCIKLII